MSTQQVRSALQYMILISLYIDGKHGERLVHQIVELPRGYSLANIFIVIMKTQRACAAIGGCEGGDGDGPVGVALNECVEVCEELGSGFDGVDMEGVMGEELDVVCPFDADDGYGWRGSEESSEVEFEWGGMEGEVGESLLMEIGMD